VAFLGSTSIQGSEKSMGKENKEYAKFLSTKKKRVEPVGKIINSNDVNSTLFDFQRDIVLWSVKMGRCAVFADTGLGKTFIQLEWARLIGKTILIFAPLSVARQTIKEGKKIHADVKYIRSQTEITTGIFITNYENIDNFNECSSLLDGIVLDESSILKSLNGETRRKLIKFFVDVKYKLCCTATPAPNDYTELGNHAEFLGVCSTAEMLSTYFVNGNKTSETVTDSGIILRKKHSNKNGTQWRMRYHAQKDYFRWLSSWAMAIRRPSDLGYEDDGFKLPKLNIIPVIINAEYIPTDELFFSGLKGLKQRADVRNQTSEKKLLEIQKLTTGKDQWLIWCGLDIESTLAKNGIEDAIEVKGSQDA